MGWEQLVAIQREAAEQRRLDQDTEPADCPRCGTPLTAGPRGGLYCPFKPGHYGVA